MGTDQHLVADGGETSKNEEVDEDGFGQGWKYLPTEPLIQMLEMLNYKDLGRCCQVCKRWNEIANLSFLWQKKFRTDFEIDPDISLPHMASSWKDEYQRVTDLVPSVEFERISEHEDEVLHVSFSNNGMMFCTCSKDATVKVFSADWPFDTIFSEDLGRSSPFRWVYTQFSQFSSSDTQLLVSGRCEGTQQGGEIIIYNIFAREFSLQARVRINPYDVMGTWLNETHILSARAHRLRVQRQSLCEVLLNKSSQEIENLMHSTVTRSFMFVCDNRNTASYLKVANMTKVISQIHRSIGLGCFHGKLHDMHIKAFAEHREAMTEAEKLRNRFSVKAYSESAAAETVSSISIKVARSGGSDQNPSDDEVSHDGKRPKLDDASEAGDYSNFTAPFSPAMRRCMAAVDNDTENSNPFSETSSPQLTDDELDRDDSEFSEVTTGDETTLNMSPPKSYKLLICFTGSDLDVPHQIGIKRIMQEECTEVVRHEIDLERMQRQALFVGNLAERPDLKTDQWDHVIDMGGQIVGMDVSPCGRFLYVNVRKWSYDPIPGDSRAPTISAKVTMVLIDLVSMETLKTFGGHTAMSDVFFLHISCNAFYVTSGSEDRQGYLWDRHYGTRLSTFRHEDVVNCVAVNPRDPGMAVSVSDDNLIKIWRSKSFHRLLSGARAKARIKSQNTS